MLLLTLIISYRHATVKALGGFSALLNRWQVRILSLMKDEVYPSKGTNSQSPTHQVVKNHLNK